MTKANKPPYRNVSGQTHFITFIGGGRRLTSTSTHKASTTDSTILTMAMVFSIGNSWDVGIKLP